MTNTPDRARNTDTMRLDWLERRSATVKPINGGSSGRYFDVWGDNDEYGSEFTLRAAIDAAMSTDNESFADFVRSIE